MRISIIIEKEDVMMPKFFIDEGNLNGKNAAICGSDVNHITKVLRLSPKSIIMVCDGRGNDYKARIISVEKTRVSLEILEKTVCEAEPDLQVTLFQGIPKAGKMEYIIEKCTELGVGRIVPVLTKRTVVKIGEEKSGEKKLARWRKTASESVKQCGRGAVPEVTGVFGLKDLAKWISGLDLCVAAYEKEKKYSLKEVLSQHKNAKTAGIFIGPEGGFEGEEIAYLEALGVRSVGLGERILRTETAGHAVLAAVMYEFDEF
jgi:16S rRNA (uracil1498-N3)-methyltransferase